MTDNVRGLIPDLLTEADAPEPWPGGHVFVPGTPIPQGSAKGYRVGNHVNITHDNGATMPWRGDVAGHVRAAIGARIVHPTGGVMLQLEFVLPRRAYEPVFWPPNQRVTRGTAPRTTKPDVDKLARAILDALTGLVYTDDAQVIELRTRKRTARIGEQPGAHIAWSPG